MTPVTVRHSVLGRLAAFLLVVLIVSPLTAPFRAMSGALEASPCGLADGIQSETLQAPAVVEAAFVHPQLSPSTVSLRVFGRTVIVERTHVNQILRL